MPYSIKEIFYTLQGEGRHSGRAAVFCRFTGCNLWSGRAEDRGRGKGGCAGWCDTDFVGTDGSGGGRYQSPSELAAAIENHWPSVAQGRTRFAVFTGGEPLLQLDKELVRSVHLLGFEIAIETNGTILPPPGLDWICVSPKAGTTLAIHTGNELKLVFPQVGAEPELFEDLDFAHFYLQPMDGPLLQENTWRASQYCLSHPLWSLGLQTHKVVGLR